MITTEIRLRAERKWGQMYREAEKAAGRAGPGRGKADQPAGAAFNDAATLESMGITPNQSSQWQKLAAFRKGKSPFAFGRQHADRLIDMHSALSAHACAHTLPCSVRALFALAKVPASYREAVVAKCRPASTAVDVTRFAEKANNCSGLLPASESHIRPLLERLEVML